MMRFLKFILLILLASVLSACSSVGAGVRSDDYIKQSHAVHPIVVPAGAVPPKQKPYYRVPPVPVQAMNAPGSLVPPGSNVLKYRKGIRVKQHHTQAQAPVVAHLEKRTKHLVLSLDAKQAWSAVGRALKKTHYQILDQDSAMGAYYVLDTRTTENKITQSTPIYRLKIKQVGKDSQVSVLNQENQPADARIAMQILGAVQQNLT